MKILIQEIRQKIETKMSKNKKNGRNSKFISNFLKPISVRVIYIIWNEKKTISENKIGFYYSVCEKTTGKKATVIV